MSKQLILHNRLFFLNLMSFFGGFVFYAPVSLLVRTRCGVTEAQFFLLEAILSVSIFFFEVPCGLLSDRLGYKNTLIAGSCFLFAARLLMFCSDRFWLFAVEAVAEGIASALFSGTFSAYLYEVEPQDFAENLSKNDNCSNLGFILSSLGFFCPVRLRRNRQPAVFHHAVFLCRAGLLFLFKAGRSKALPPAQKTGGGPGSSFAGSTGHRAGFSSGMCQRCLSAGQFFLCFTTDQGRHPGKIYDRFHPCLFGNPAERPAHRSPAASVAATAFPAAVFGCRLFSGFLSATALRLWDYPSHAAVPYRFVGAWGLSGAVSEQTD